MPPSFPIGTPPPARFPRADLRRLGGQWALLVLWQSSRVWLAPEFLLQRKRGFCTQEFRRFAYRDVQALQICGSSAGLVYNLLCGVPAALLLLVGGLTLLGDGWSTPWLVAGGGFLLLLAINLARGPTCVCVIVTELGAQTLPSLRRWRAAQRAVALIAERVAAAQRAP